MGVEYSHYLLPRDRDHRPSPAELLRLVEALRREGWVVDPRTPAYPAMVATLLERYREDERLGDWEPRRGLGRLLPWRRLRAQTPFRVDFDRPYGDARRSGAYARTVEGRLPGETVLDEGWLAAHRHEPFRLVWPVPSLAVTGLRHPLRPRPCAERQTDRVYLELALHWSDDFVYHTSELVEPFDESPACAACGEALGYEPEIAHTDFPFFDPAIRRVCPRCGARFRPEALTAVVRDFATGEARRVAGGAVYRFALVVESGKWIPHGPASLEPDLVELCRTTLGQDLVELGDGSF